MNRRDLFGLFAGLPFVGWVKPKRRRQPVVWEKLYLRFADGKKYDNGESCQVGPFRCWIYQPLAGMPVSGNIIEKPEEPDNSGLHREVALKDGMATRRLARQWCLRRVHQIARWRRLRAEEVIEILGGSE